MAAEHALDPVVKAHGLGDCFQRFPKILVGRVGCCQRALDAGIQIQRRPTLCDGGGDIRVESDFIDDEQRFYHARLDLPLNLAQDDSTRIPVLE